MKILKITSMEKTDEGKEHEENFEELQAKKNTVQIDMKETRKIRIEKDR